MIKKSALLLLLILLIYNFLSRAQTSPIVSEKDFELFTGKWQGSLTYLDYKSGKPYTMPANIEIQRIGTSKQFIFANTYPDEPKANDKDTITISGKGDKLNTEPIKSKKKLTDGSLEIITENLGKDGNDNKAALIRITYTAGNNLLSIKKDVRFTGQTAWVLRHEYRYKKL